jgi:hypothetical protein
MLLKGYEIIKDIDARIDAGRDHTGEHTGNIGTVLNAIKLVYICVIGQ